MQLLYVTSAPPPGRRTDARRAQRRDARVLLDARHIILLLFFFFDFSFSVVCLPLIFLIHAAQPRRRRAPSRRVMSAMRRLCRAARHFHHARFIACDDFRGARAPGDGSAFLARPPRATADARSARCRHKDMLRDERKEARQAHAAARWRGFRSASCAQRRRERLSLPPPA